MKVVKFTHEADGRQRCKYILCLQKKKLDYSRH